jgi:hypothetical protein
MFQIPRNVYKGFLKDFQLFPATALQYNFGLAKKFHIEYPRKPSIIAK